MLIFFFRSHCKICYLSSDRSRVFVGNGQILQKDLKMKINILAELRKRVCLYIHALVLFKYLPSLDVKQELFVT